MKFFKRKQQTQPEQKKQPKHFIYKRNIEKVFKTAFKRGAKDFVDADTAQDANIKDVGNMYDRGTIPDNVIEWYGSHSFIGYQSCAILAQHWLVMRACVVPAKEAVRKGWELSSQEKEEELTQLQKLDKKYKLTKNLVEFVQFGRVFGLRLAMFDVQSTDPDYYEKPFNIDGVTKGSYKGIIQIDPYWVAPILDNNDSTNPSSRTFYEPTYWIINGKKIHRSHLVIMRNVEVPDILKPTYFYGGISTPQLIYNRVYASERTADEAPQLALSKRLNVYKTDVEAAMSNQQEFEEDLLQWNYYRDNFGIKLIGEDEEIQQFETSLSDLDAVIMSQYQLVASAANIPVTKLLGTTPKGFNSSGAYEEQSYHEELESIQAHDLTPLLERHYQLSIKSDLDIDIFDFEIAFESTEAETEEVRATVNLQKAQADQIYLDMGAIDAQMVHDRLVKDKKSGYNGLDYEED